jgi:hypothetical protein
LNSHALGDVEREGLPEVCAPFSQEVLTSGLSFPRAGAVSFWVSLFPGESALASTIATSTLHLWEEIQLVSVDHFGNELLTWLNSARLSDSRSTDVCCDAMKSEVKITWTNWSVMNGALFPGANARCTS